MYHCTDCEENFERPIRYIGKDKHQYSFCPFCSSKNIVIKEAEYCKCCGKKLRGNNKEYCSYGCMRKAPQMFERDRKRYEAIRNSPIYLFIRELTEYNKKHNAKLSYGQYEALVCGG